MLFADGEIGNGVWTIIGVIAGYLFKWLGDRDKLNHDTLLKDQGHQIKSQGETIKSQGDKITALETSHKDCMESHSKCEENTAEQERKINDLQVELNRKVADLLRQDAEDKRELETKIETKISKVLTPPSQ